MAATATPPSPHHRPRPARVSARPRGAARREALLEAVLRIVAEVGPDAVTHRRVAEVAGLPLASTTYWFDSKEQLLTAALELAAERDTAWLLSYAAAVADDVGDGADLIDAIVGAIVSDDDHAPTPRTSVIATLSLLLEAARRPALQEISRRWTEAYLLTVGRLLARAGSADPRGDAELLIGAADGLILEQLSLGEREDLRPRLRRLARALVAER